MITTQALSFELQAGESLLEGLERTGHVVEYQCRGGYCGSCRTTIISGDVSYASTPLAFVAAGEILPCCARPQGDLVLEVYAEQIKKQA